MPRRLIRDDAAICMQIQDIFLCVAVFVLLDEVIAHLLPKTFGKLQHPPAPPTMHQGYPSQSNPGTYAVLPLAADAVLVRLLAVCLCLSLLDLLLQSLAFSSFNCGSRASKRRNSLTSDASAWSWPICHVEGHATSFVALVSAGQLACTISSSRQFAAHQLHAVTTPDASGVCRWTCCRSCRWCWSWSRGPSGPGAA